MATILEVAKQVVESSIDLSEYEEQTIGDVFRSEYGQYRGFNQGMCCDWLRGLPTACSVPFCDSDILALLARHGIIRKSESAQIKLVDKYWQACGHALFQLIKSGK